MYRMIIRGNKSLRDVQEEFNMNYPFLRIEFLNESANSEGPMDMLKNFDSSAKDQIGHFALSYSGNELEILPEQTITELEEKFREVFNANIQVLCQSGNDWVKAMKRNYWSLAYQNEHAERLNGMLGNME